MKNILFENFLLPNNKISKNSKSKIKKNNRILDNNDILLKKIIFNPNNNALDNDLRKYLNIILQNLGNSFDIFESIYGKISGKPYIITKEEYYLQKQKQLFLSRLLKNFYSGKWEYFPYIPDEEHKKISDIAKSYYTISSKNKFKIGNYKNGTASFEFKQGVEMATKQGVLSLSMENLEGNYYDNWIQHISYIRMNELNHIIDKNNQLYIIKGEFDTSLIKGRLFKYKKHNQKKKQCKTFTEIEFPLAYIPVKTNLNNKSILITNISTIIPNNFTMVLSSTCGFRIKVKAEIYDRVKDLYDTKEKVNFFSYYCIIGSILYLIGSTCLTFSLNRNESAISGISIECFCQNLAWNTYSALNNINLGLIHYDFIGNFCILAILPLINFTIFDLRFLYFYWKIKKRFVNDRQYIILRLKFFSLFYGLLLFSFFSISSFYINKIYIAILCILIWTPQIIHNIVNNNKYIYPLFYIFSTTLDRLKYPLYFRGNKNNFLKLKSDHILLLVLLIIIIITVIILYLQMFLGPRFMLPSKYQKKNIEFHKSKEELLKVRPDCIKEECVICLSPLIDKDKNKQIDQIDKNNTSQNNFNNNNKQNDVIMNNNEQEYENSSENPTKLKIEQTNRSYNSRIDLISSTIKQQQNLKNNNNSKLKNELHLCKNNNDSLVVNIKKSTQKNYNKSSICKNICEIAKIIIFKNMFKFYKKTNKLREKEFMIIACGHMFHTSCVEKWFDRKKECPSCRASMDEYF